MKWILTCYQHQVKNRTFPALRDLLPITTPLPKNDHYLNFFHHRRVLSILELHISGVRQYVFCTCFFSPILSLWDSFMLLQEAMGFSFSLLCSSPLPDSTTICPCYSNGQLGCFHFGAIYPRAESWGHGEGEYSAFIDETVFQSSFIIHPPTASVWDLGGRAIFL